MYRQCRNGEVSQEGACSQSDCDDERLLAPPRFLVYLRRRWLLVARDRTESAYWRWIRRTQRFEGCPSCGRDRSEAVFRSRAFQRLGHVADIVEHFLSAPVASGLLECERS